MGNEWCYEFVPRGKKYTILCRYLSQMVGNALVRPLEIYLFLSHMMSYYLVA